MKLSKKIVAIVLAAMTLTAIPVVAASNNTVVNGNTVYELNSKTAEPAISIDFLDNAGEEEEFFFELKGGEWLKDSDTEDKAVIESKFNVIAPDTWESKDGKYTFTWQDDKVMKVNVSGDVIKASRKITFNLPVKLTGETTEVTIVANGGSTVTSGRIGGASQAADNTAVIETPAPSVSPSPSATPIEYGEPNVPAQEDGIMPISETNENQPIVMKQEALTVKFVIGQSTYSSNGEKVKMDAASYIKSPGYTMVPVRFALEAFGINDIKADKVNGKSVINVTDGNKTIKLTVGDKTALVDGKKVELSVAPEIANGRTYAPVGEIAKILGVKSNWDAKTQTATFTREALKNKPVLPVETPVAK